MATHIACFEDTLVLVVGGKVYTGVLAGDGMSGRTPPVLKPLPGLPLPVRRIGAGKGFLGIVTVDGELYTCGNNRYGQLGLDFASRSDVTTPTLVAQFVFQDARVPVRDFAGGWDHSVVITDQHVFACGNNSNGILGNGEIEGESHRFWPVDWRGITLQNASQVACGDGHTILLLHGTVITWGAKDHQCLGKYDNAHVIRPRRLPPGLFEVETMVRGEKIGYVEEIVHVSAGMCHQAAVGAGGTLFTWGNRRFHKLGHATATDCFRPKPVSFQHTCAEAEAPVPHIVSVCCGRKCTAMLARDGMVFKAGKLDGESVAALPHRLGSKWANHAQKLQVSSECVFAIDELGALWAWGVRSPFVFHSEQAVVPVDEAEVVWRTEDDPMRLDPPEWRSAHALAFAMVGHRRLGEDSRATALEVCLIDMVLRCLNAW